MNDLHLVTTEDVARRPGHCTRCAVPTSNPDGLCRSCRNGYGLPDPRRIPTERLVAYVTLVRQVLERRRAEIDAVLGGKP